MIPPFHVFPQVFIHLVPRSIHGLPSSGRRLHWLVRAALTAPNAPNALEGGSVGPHDRLRCERHAEPEEAGGRAIMPWSASYCYSAERHRKT